MRERFRRIVHLTTGVVIQQDDGLRLAGLTQSLDDIHRLVLQHPAVGGDIDLLLGLHIAQDFRAFHPFAMAQNGSMLAHRSLQLLHARIGKKR